MNKLLKSLAAQHLYQLCSHDNNETVAYYTYENKEMQENGVSTFEILKEMMQEGLSPFEPVMIENDRVELLAIELFKMGNEHACEIMKYITPDQLKKLSVLDSEKLMQYAFEMDSEHARPLFDKGWRLNQGNNQNALEYNMLESGQHEFFALLTQYQPDFDFTREYTCYGEAPATLLEIGAEILQTERACNANTVPNLEMQSEILKTITHYQEMQKELKDKTQENKRPKI